jgi:2-keto-4-pentenoate hydratase
MAGAEDTDIQIDQLIQPKIEAEVAFVLGRDLPDEQVTTVDVIRATDYVLPALEVVDSRIAGWDIGIVDTVADNASSGRYVLGSRPVRLSDVDLRRCGMALDYLGRARSTGVSPSGQATHPTGRSAEPVSVGAGAACLGHPVTAVAWLAATLARAGRPLRAGDLVLSGALGPMVAVVPGGAYRARINGLGEVRARFSWEGTR